MRGLGPCRRCLGCAAPAGGHDPSRAYPGPQGSGRRRLGVPLSRPGQAPAPPATRHTPHDEPGQPRESPRPAGHTLPTTCGPRPTGAPRHRRQGPCARGMPGGHGQPGARRRVRCKDRAPLSPQRRRLPTCIRSGAAPVWGHPRPRSAAWTGSAGRERGWPPTAARQVGANPPSAAGSPVVSSWLRLCRGTEDETPHADLTKRCSPLLTSEVIATLRLSRTRKLKRSVDMTSDVKGEEHLFYVRIRVFSLLSLGRAGASTTRRWITLISVDWLPPSVPPSGACLSLGTSVPGGLLTPPRVPPHRGCVSTDRRCNLGEPLLEPAVSFRPEVAWPLAWQWPTSRRAIPGPWRRRPDGHGCL